MIRVRVRDKGQITLPIELRSKYRMKTGTLLEIHERPEGVLLQPVAPLKPRSAVGTEEYRKLIKELEETRRKWH